MGIDSVLNHILKICGKIQAVHSIVSKETEEAFVRIAKKSLEWREEVPSSCPLAKERIDRLVAIADEKLPRGWRSRDLPYGWWSRDPVCSVHHLQMQL